jgi:hypothetical protein
MEWQKLGQVWRSSDCLSWGIGGTLTPTPFLMGDGVIRVYCGIRDGKGVARIGFFDVLENRPNKVINFSSHPILDIGVPGAFDDNGMLLGDLIRVGDEVRMYYVGFQLAIKTKFLAFGGVAISKDNGNSFKRYTNAPIIDRDSSGLFIRAIHGILKTNDSKFQAWFSEGAGWEIINQKPYPQYSIATISSPDGLTFPPDKGTKIEIERAGEYRIGRSRVFSFNKDDHIMTFTYGKANGEYASGYASSSDLKDWVRRDDWGLNPGPDEFDSFHLAYPALIKTTDGTILCFYNGNDMGIGGIGVAKLIKR